MFYYPVAVIAAAAHMAAKEHTDFCRHQYLEGRKPPSRDEYMHARNYAYCIENPPPYPWWKSTLASILTRVFRL